MTWFRWLVIVVLFYLIWRVLKGLVGPSRQAESIQGSASPARRTAEAVELVQDPQCGVYFPRTEGIATLIEGRVYYFHNPECRDNYLRARGSGGSGGSK